MMEKIVGAPPDATLVSLIMTNVTLNVMLMHVIGMVHIMKMENYSVIVCVGQDAITMK